MNEQILILSIAFVLDLLLGDPPYRYHPVRLIGQCIQSLEGRLRKVRLEGRGGGMLLVLILLAVSLLITFSLHALLTTIHPWLASLFDLYLTYSFLALGDLLRHIVPVIESLEDHDIHSARRALAMLVGRDVDALDEQGLARGAVETLAENFVDGFLSPVFWFVAGMPVSSFFGTPPVLTSVALMLLFKGASTLDSMVGYRDARYLSFGWAGARLDDLMSFIPARLSLLFLFLGAALIRLRPIQGLRIALRDRLKHDSPNAGHPESFVAGALGIRLGGPTLYPDGTKEKPFLGDGNEEPGPWHIRRTKALVVSSGWAAMMGLLPVFCLLSLSVAQ